MAYTTIDDPGEHFKVLTYTGNASTNAITGVGFAPDLIWIKHRTAGHDWTAWDTTRGTEVMLTTNEAYAEADGSSHGADGVTAFGSDGFTLGNVARTNASSAAHVAYNWKLNAGTRATFTESGDNPGGGRQVNATAGVSLIDYTGTGGAGTIAHGLGAVPHAIFVHDRGGNNHAVYHKGIASDAETDYLRLDTNIAAVDESGRWNDTAPTSSVITLGTNNEVNGDGRTYIAWVFTSIKGYSKFGSYKGNYNADGPFIYTGFKPAFVMVKEADNANDWDLRDSARDPYNHVDTWLRPNTTDAEGDSDAWDFLSNGFKIRQASNRTNRSDGTLIYAAFAENPFVSSEGVPCTAG